MSAIVYRKQNGESGLAGGTVMPSDDDAATSDARDYDIDYYVRLLSEAYIQRLARAFTPADFSAVFADPDQFSLFTPPIESIRTVLTVVPQTGSHGGGTAESSTGPSL